MAITITRLKLNYTFLGLHEEENARKSYLTKNDFKKAITEICSTITEDLISILVASMPKRIESVLKANGKHTKY
ncbi:hypothetical protein BDAP_000601 [Binucleata daphniae]